MVVVCSPLVAQVVATGQQQDQVDQKFHLGCFQAHVALATAYVALAVPPETSDRAEQVSLLPGQ